MDLTTLIGLARAAATCDPALPKDFVLDEPSTEVYLTEIAELPLSGLKNYKDYWQRLFEARPAAAVQLKADLRTFLSQTYVPKPAYRGLLGAESFSQFPLIRSATPEAVLPLITQYQIGGELVIAALGLIVSEACTVTVNLYKDGGVDPVQTQELVLLARSIKRTTLTTPWRLPLDGSRYEIRTSLPAGVRVADNVLNCGCTSGMSLLHSSLVKCCDGVASGYLLSLENNCRYDSLIEKLVGDERTGLVLAYMMAYQTGYQALMKAMDTKDVNRDTLLDRKTAEADAATCRGEYLNRLGWIKTATPKDYNTDDTCYYCKPKYGAVRGGIFR